MTTPKLKASTRFADVALLDILKETHSCRDDLKRAVAKHCFAVAKQCLDINHSFQEEKRRYILALAKIALTADDSWLTENLVAVEEYPSFGIEDLLEAANAYNTVSVVEEHSPFLKETIDLVFAAGTIALMVEKTTKDFVSELRQKRKKLKDAANEYNEILKVSSTWLDHNWHEE